MTDEKILKKIGKLLTMYGASDDEKQKFLTDLEDAKYDDEEEETDESSKENSGETEQETSQEQEELGEETETEETEEVEQGEDDNQEELETESEETVEESSEELPTENESEESQEQSLVENQEQLGEEQQQELPPVEQEQPSEQTFDAQSSIEELKKSIDGLAARFQTIEDTLAKLGTPVENEQIGVSPAGNPIDQSQDTTFDEINRKRIGY